MRLKNTVLITFAAALGLCLLGADAANAQAPVSESKYKAYTKKFGLDQVGGYIRPFQGASRDVKKTLRCYNGTFIKNGSKTRAGVATGVRIFGKSIEAARVEASSEVMDADTYTRPVIRNFKVWYKSYYWTWKKVAFIKVPVRKYRMRYYWEPRVVGHRTYGYRMNQSRFIARYMIGGLTVKRVTSPVSIKISKKAGPFNIFKKTPKKTFLVGPVPVTVRANAGFAASASVGTEMDNRKMTTSMGPKLNAYGFGWVSAGVGGSILGAKLEAGVKGTLKFANTTVDYQLASSLDKLIGSANWKVTPVGLYMSLYATAKFLTYKVKASLQVWSWSMKAFGGILFRAL